MRRAAAMLCATAMVLVTATAFAQKPTNFAGTWTREAPAGGGAAAGGGGGGGGRGGGRGGGGGAFNCGMECTIAQDATSITITPVTQNGPGEPRKLMLTGDSKFQGRGQGGAVEMTAKSKWVGDKLEISVTRDMGGTMVTQVQTLSIVGGKLNVVTNSGQPDAQPQTATYTKK